jgi:hypothetical protein
VGGLDVSQQYGPSWLVTRIVLPFSIFVFYSALKGKNDIKQDYGFRLKTFMELHMILKFKL